MSGHDVDELMEHLKEEGLSDAFGHGWLDGEFDGIYSPSAYTGRPAELDDYAYGFQYGMLAAIDGREQAMVQLKKQLNKGEQPNA